jgi:LysR family nitrogen assimilation transcriptional regulator
MLTARQIEYFVAIARAGSFSKAALALGLSQPALTKQVKLIEQDLKLRVFERTGRGVRLTSAGETVMDFAADISHQFDRLEAAIAHMRGSPSGAVTVATTPLVAHLVTSPVALAARAVLPDVQLRITEGYGAGVTGWVAEGRADLAVSYIPLRQVKHLIDGELLFDDEMFLVGAPSMFARHKVGAALRFADLAGLPMVLPTGQNGLRRWLDKASRDLGFLFQTALEIDALSALLDTVAWGHGFTVLPRLAVIDDLNRRGLLTAAISHPAIPAQLTLFTARGRHSPAAERVIDLVKDHVRALRARSFSGLEGSPESKNGSDSTV